VENTAEMGDEIHRILIPTVGTVFTLQHPWALVIMGEYRNRKFLDSLKAFGLKNDAGTFKQEGSSIGGHTHTLKGNETVFPAGTKLKVDRIYIKKGASAFDSITFILKKGDFPGFPKLNGRFWAKLYDVNRIICKFDNSTLKVASKVSLLTQLAAAAYDPAIDGKQKPHQ